MKHFTALSFLMMTTAAWAQATPQGAADLTATFQTYLGRTPGVVNVVPDGEEYEITLDASPLIAMVPPEAGAAMTATPVVMRVSDNGDGTWAVTQDQPFSFTLGVPGVIAMEISMGQVACEGTYDTALRSFAQQDCEMTDIVVDQTVQDPNMGEQVTKQTIEAMTLTQTATAGANGGVDGEMDYAATGVMQTMALPQGPGAPALPIVVTLDSYAVEGTNTGLRMDAMLAAIAWAVANPSQAMMTEKRAEMKAILEGGLPLFERIDATMTGTGLNVETPIGPVSIASVGVDVSMKGAVADGLFREALRFEGVTPPPGVLPPFVEPLIPERFSVDFAVESFDAGAAVGVLLGLFDLPAGGAPGPEFEGALMQALMPDGSVDIVIAPGEVANATYTLNYEGRMSAGPGMMPVGTARVTATGFDAAMAVLDGAPDEMKQGVVPAMGMARGLAREQPDGSLLWEIDATEPGTLKVNGLDLMGMQ
ncbi:MAG: hypothetical protein ACT4OK_14150 [Gemmobacter sp.]